MPLVPESKKSRFHMQVEARGAGGRVKQIAWLLKPKWRTEDTFWRQMIFSFHWLLQRQHHISAPAVVIC